MKRNEILAVFFIAIFAGVLVFVLATSVFHADEKSEEVEVVAPISSDISVEDDSILLDKTRVDQFSDVSLNQENNNQPFSEQ
jgi:hypothetical protein